MTERRDQTLTAVTSPTSVRDRPDVAVFLVAGSAETPGLSAGRRLRVLSQQLEIGRVAGDDTRPDVNVVVLDDALISGRHARIVPQGEGEHALIDLNSKNGTWVDNVRVADRVTLRDGAMIFLGNHVGLFRRVSPATLEAMSGELANPLGPVATASPALALTIDRLRRLARSDGELLLVGETGAGKEVYARAVHATSGRTGPFIAINCAAIPRELVESELFGYRQGAHSTAHQAKRGLLEEAEGGTLFLDEIGEMTPESQTKLLRFVQDRELTPLGATRPRRLDVRIIAATHRHGPTAAGNSDATGLRDDMLARLGAAPLYLPPLRDRIEDLGALIAHFLRATPAVKFEQPAFRALCLHRWPLNVRELEKIVTTAAVLTGGLRPISLRDLPDAIARSLDEGAPAAPPHPPAVGAGTLRAYGPAPSSAQLETLLRKYDGNVAEVSRDLGKHRAAIWRWMKKFGLAPETFRRGGRR